MFEIIVTIDKKIVSKFGLTGDATQLVMQTREGAKSILADLLWRDQAYSSECMPIEQAEFLAEGILSQYEGESCQYFSNKESSQSDTWLPFTESTFDSGIIGIGKNGLNFCIWFEDED